MSISTPVKIITFLVSGCFAICPEGIVSDDKREEVICPGQSRSFFCTTTDVISMGWDINGEWLFFSQTDMPGSIFPSNNEAIAYLVDRRVPNQNDTNSVVGNLTSVLRYTPTSDNITTVNISCTSGSNACDTIQLLVHGRDGIDMPSNISHSVTDGVITYQWDHPTRNLVHHYILALDALDQLIQVNSTQLYLPHVPSMTHTYSGTVRAVSICGHESDALSFTGTTSPHMEPMEPQSTMKPDKLEESSIAVIVISTVLIVTIALLLVMLLIIMLLIKTLWNKKKPNTSTATTEAMNTNTATTEAKNTSTATTEAKNTSTATTEAMNTSTATTITSLL